MTNKELVKVKNSDSEDAKIVGIGIFKSILGSLPIGNTAVSIYNELQSKQIERKIIRLEQFYQSLDNSIKAVEDKVNKEYLTNDNFLDVFETATRYVVSERQKKKRDYFKNILVNSITQKESDYDKTEKYFRILDDLEETELKILAILKDPRKHRVPFKSYLLIERKQDSEGKEKFIVRELNKSSSFPVSKRRIEVLKSILGLDREEVEQASNVLLSKGLIKENLGAKEILSVGDPIQVLDNQLTAKGKDFVEFLEEK